MRRLRMSGETYTPDGLTMEDLRREHEDRQRKLVHVSHADNQGRLPPLDRCPECGNG